MAREVNVYLGDWTALGTNASVPRYSVNLTTQWIDNAGASHTDTRAVTFPNVLSGRAAATFEGLHGADRAGRDPAAAGSR